MPSQSTPSTKSKHPVRAPDPQTNNADPLEEEGPSDARYKNEGAR